MADTKNAEQRTLLLLAPVVQELQTLPRPLGGTTLLFSRKTDRLMPIVEHDFYRHWKAAKAAAGITDFRFHDLRHSAASYMVEAGVPLVTVAEVVGHKTLAMVQRYSHLAAQHKLDVLENAFAGKLG